MRTHFGPGIVAALVAFASMAGAQTAEPGATATTTTTGATLRPAVREPADPRRGPEIGLQLGAGGFENSSAAAFTSAPRGSEHLFWPGFGAQLNAGYRALPWLAFGAHLAYQNNTARDLPQGVTSAMANSVALGLYSRFYVGSAAGWRLFDPWVSVGVDPYAGVFVVNSTQAGNARSEFMTVAIPVAIGADFYLAPRVALGVTAQVSPWIPWQACQTLPGRSTACTQSNLEANTYAFAGLNLRYTFGPE